MGTPQMPVVIYSRHFDVYSPEELLEETKTVVVDAIVTALTVAPTEKLEAAAEPKSRDIVFKGTFEEVTQYFYDNGWSDGLPIVPPTLAKVDEFLKYTDWPSDKVLGTFTQTSSREATVWNTAVNGVMAGCRPEYMPILQAITSIAAEGLPFGVYTLGNTPGPEVQITQNGPIVKQLGFNYQQGALQVGYQANTSIGRFWRLYMRNVVGYSVGPNTLQADKGTFGPTGIRPVLAENEGALKAIGWQPMSVDRGFKAGENVVTLSGCVSTDSTYSMGTDNAEHTLDRIAPRLIDIELYYTSMSCGQDNPCRPEAPQLMFSPQIANHLASQGYTKDKVKQYLWEHTLLPASRYDQVKAKPHDWCSDVVSKGGPFPDIYCESSDPARLIPLYPTPAALDITVSGDPARDNVYICARNGSHGFPTSKQIELPANWETLMEELGYPSFEESRTW